MNVRIKPLNIAGTVLYSKLFEFTNDYWLIRWKMRTQNIKYTQSIKMDVASPRVLSRLETLIPMLI